MVLTKEYRICMPLTVEEYRIGQLYMIARHSHEQSDADEGVEVVENSECEDPVHGKGQFTEKRIHLSSKLPYWIQALIPRIFYVTEKAWNYYPFTITEYTCSFMPKFQISIKTRYEDNNGSSENCLGLTPVELIHREVDFIDIAYDELSAKHYKEEEDPKFFQSKKTGRGPLIEGWRETTQPIMCSYKLVDASFEVWGMQTRVEDFIHKAKLQLFQCIRDILLLGHRQAFAWIDEWHDMTLDDVREYEKKMHAATNEKIQPKTEPANPSQPQTPSGSIPSSPKSPTASANRSWFSWS
ncbi:cytoplasmic phosphatidylinositol transfer protein 1 isoform X1 [Microplitis mediator]|uniref:cytoplasmic phosphatidylinositol transfer protein 1 isoform X1 n=1 Tax=Microplitis mediator TaxID=375433 RepID=UPI00255691FE|nr:cytoplasmic phosphatidylinositol transfer protein 1 isoform X1 [Microplitis mediator]